MIPAILSISCHCEAYRVAVTLLIRHCERSAAIWVGVPGQACKNPVLITLTVPLITTPPGLLRRLSTPRNDEQWLQCFFLCHSCESRNPPGYSLLRMLPFPTITVFVWSLVSLRNCYFTFPFSNQHWCGYPLPAFAGTRLAGMTSG